MPPSTRDTQQAQSSQWELYSPVIMSERVSGLRAALVAASKAEEEEEKGGSGGRISRVKGMNAADAAMMTREPLVAVAVQVSDAESEPKMDAEAAGGDADMDAASATATLEDMAVAAAQETVPVEEVEELEVDNGAVDADQDNMPDTSSSAAQAEAEAEVAVAVAVAASQSHSQQLQLQLQLHQQQQQQQQRHGDTNKSGDVEGTNRIESLASTKSSSTRLDRLKGLLVREHIVSHISSSGLVASLPDTPSMTPTTASFPTGDSTAANATTNTAPLTTTTATATNTTTTTNTATNTNTTNTPVSTPLYSLFPSSVHSPQQDRAKARGFRVNWSASTPSLSIVPVPHTAGRGLPTPSPSPQVLASPSSTYTAVSPLTSISTSTSTNTNTNTIMATAVEFPSADDARAVVKTPQTGLPVLSPTPASTSAGSTCAGQAFAATTPAGTASASSSFEAALSSPPTAYCHSARSSTHSPTPSTTTLSSSPVAPAPPSPATLFKLQIAAVQQSPPRIQAAPTSPFRFLSPHKNHTGLLREESNFSIIDAYDYSHTESDAESVSLVQTLRHHHEAFGPDTPKLEDYKDVTAGIRESTQEDFAALDEVVRGARSNDEKMIFGSVSPRLRPRIRTLPRRTSKFEILSDVNDDDISDLDLLPPLPPSPPPKALPLMPQRRIDTANVQPRAKPEEDKPVETGHWQKYSHIQDPSLTEHPHPPVQQGQSLPTTPPAKTRPRSKSSARELVKAVASAISAPPLPLRRSRSTHNCGITGPNDSENKENIPPSGIAAPKASNKTGSKTETDPKLPTTSRPNMKIEGQTGSRSHAEQALQPAQPAKPAQPAQPCSGPMTRRRYLTGIKDGARIIQHSTVLPAEVLRLSRLVDPLTVPSPESSKGSASSYSPRSRLSPSAKSVALSPLAARLRQAIETRRRSTPDANRGYRSSKEANDADDEGESDSDANEDTIGLAIDSPTRRFPLRMKKKKKEQQPGIAPPENPSSNIEPITPVEAESENDGANMEAESTDPFQEQTHASGSRKSQKEAVKKEAAKQPAWQIRSPSGNLLGKDGWLKHPERPLCVRERREAILSALAKATNQALPAPLLSAHPALSKQKQKQGSAGGRSASLGCDTKMLPQPQPRLPIPAPPAFSRKARESCENLSLNQSSPLEMARSWSEPTNSLKRKDVSSAVVQQRAFEREVSVFDSDSDADENESRQGGASTKASAGSSGKAGRKIKMKLSKAEVQPDISEKGKSKSHNAPVAAGEAKDTLQEEEDDDEKGSSVWSSVLTCFGILPSPSLPPRHAHPQEES